MKMYRVACFSLIIALFLLTVGYIYSAMVLNLLTLFVLYAVKRNKEVGDYD